MITLKEYKNYNENEILSLYKSAGWINYTKDPAMLKDAYENSLYILGAYYEEQLAGIIRVVGDGHSVIFIQDLLVLPEYQRKGIGTMLMNSVLEKYGSVYQTILMTDDTEKTNAFYSSTGFIPASKFGCMAYVKINRR